MPGSLAGKVARSNAGVAAGIAITLSLALLALLALVPVVAAAAGGAGESAEEEESGRFRKSCFCTISVIVIAIIIIWYLLRIDRRRLATFNAFAERYGLEVSGTSGWFPNPMVEGTLGHRRLTLKSDAYEAQHLITHTRLRISLVPPFGGHLVLRHEGLQAKLGKLVADTEDIQLYDVEFDPHYIVQCPDPSFPKDVLRPEIREKLLRVKKYQFTWSLDDAEARRAGEEFDVDSLQTLVEILLDVAEELEKYGRPK